MLNNVIAIEFKAFDLAGNALNSVSAEAAAARGVNARFGALASEQDGKLSGGGSALHLTKKSLSSE